MLTPFSLLHSFAAVFFARPVFSLLCGSAPLLSLWLVLFGCISPFCLVFVAYLPLLFSLCKSKTKQIVKLLSGFYDFSFFKITWFILHISQWIILFLWLLLCCIDCSVLISIQNLCVTLIIVRPCIKGKLPIKKFYLPLWKSVFFNYGRVILV